MDNACASSSSPCASLSKKLSSNIWNCFDRIEIILENNKKEIKAKCKICSKLLSGGSNSGTSHFKCDTPIPRGPLTTRQPAETLVNVGSPDLSHENRTESPLYGELYPDTNLSQY